MNRHPKMTALARSFPELRRAAPLDPFAPEVLDAYACSGVGHGASCAARFVLSVWSGDTGALDIGRESPAWVWQCQRFDLHEALQCWDEGHRAACVAWVSAPWWP